MPIYPTPSQYREALQWPHLTLLDAELQQATPETDALGLPRAISGAFATVFVLNGRTQRWAVRCFHAPVADLEARYRALAKHLKQHPELPFVPFTFLPEGIQVEGQRYPVLKMAWVEGLSLNRFVAQHLENPEILAQLSRAWVLLVEQLARAGMAHGDLQHGNVLVSLSEGQLRLTLVDYDAVYVPALRGRKSPELGHRNYQHPDRNEADYGPWIDRFPALVILTALEALRHRPDLWARYGDEDALLFRAHDFYAPDQSSLFQELMACAPVSPLATVLHHACRLEPKQVPSLQDAQQGAPKVWALRRRLYRPVATKPARNGFERAFLPALLIWSAFSGVVGWGLGLLSGISLWGTGLLGGLSLAVYHYRHLAVVRRRRRLQREQAFLARLLNDLERQLAGLMQERQVFLDQQQQLQLARLHELREAALRDRLKYHFIDEAASFEGLSHKVVIRLKAVGIRNAYQATPERVAKARQLSDETRTRVNLWRAALIARYQQNLPDRLSPAEELRLARYVEHRLAHFEQEMQRIREKIRAQQTEQAHLRERLAALPSVSLGKYLAYLLRLSRLPRLEKAPVPKPIAVRLQRPSVIENPRPWWQQPDA
jgi:hypothetical protein